MKNTYPGYRHSVRPFIVDNTPQAVWPGPPTSSPVLEARQPTVWLVNLGSYGINLTAGGIANRIHDFFASKDAEQS